MMQTRLNMRSVRPVQHCALYMVFVIALAWTVMVAPVRADARPMPETFADLVEELLPAVVDIYTTQARDASDRSGYWEGMPLPPKGSPLERYFREFYEQFRQGGKDTPPPTMRSLGSGFVVDARGIVVTNNHVVEEADTIRVRLHDGTVFEAEVLGRDPRTDIAVLKIDPGDTRLHTVSFGDSDTVRVGDWVLAIGTPLNLSGTVTAGIVSARGRDIRHGAYDDFIQTDASINTGNSGGPLFNLDGKVVGINTAIYSRGGGSVGIGFAVASRLAMPVIGQLREYGAVRRGWLGVRIQTVTPEIADAIGLDEATGAMVAQVTSDGPAEKAGIEPGDVILSFGGTDVATMRELPLIVAETPVGSEVPVAVWRERKRVTLTVEIGQLVEEDKPVVASLQQPDGGEARTVRIEGIGIEVSDLTEQLREDYGIDDTVEGAVITGVAPDGPAAENNLAVGDVITEVGQKKVRSAREVARIINDTGSESGRSDASVLFMVNRGGNTSFVGVPLDRG